jgi:hypothetical protein
VFTVYKKFSSTLDGSQGYKYHGSWHTNPQHIIAHPMARSGMIPGGDPEDMFSGWRSDLEDGSRNVKTWAERLAGEGVEMTEVEMMFCIAMSPRFGAVLNPPHLRVVAAPDLGEVANRLAAQAARDAELLQ